MAAPRPYWKGYLRLSLVSIAVELYTAVQSGHRPSMHQIHRPTGKRIRYEKSVPGVGPVDTDEIARGVEVGDETYVIIEPEEIEELKVPSKHTLDLVQFVDEGEIDPRYFDRPYYLAPGSDLSSEGFAVMRAALRGEGKAAIGQLSMRGHEYLVAVRPLGRGMLLETLRYADEVRKPDTLFDDIPDDDGLDGEMTELARRLIRDRAAPFDPSAFHDTYADALRDLIEAKRGKRKLVHVEEGEPRKSAEVVDLMAALKKSVEGGRGDVKKAPGAKKKRATRKTGQPGQTRRSAARGPARKGGRSG